MDIIVAYDVINNKRRRKISEEMESIGVRINKSVFLCPDTKWSVDEIAEMLKKLCTKKDSIFIFPLCKSCAEKSYICNILKRQNARKKPNLYRFIFEKNKKWIVL